MRNLWIHTIAVETLTDEANLTSPLETGGLLIGYISEDKQSVVVRNIVGPGTEAEHGHDFYIPDYNYHRQEAGSYYDESMGRLTYLGDWHSHPQGHLSLSWRDKRALRNIARYPGNYIDQPCMLILSGEVNQWRFAAWQISRQKRSYFFCQWLYSELCIKTYDNN